MQSNWRIGSLFGIPFFIDPSWFFILALVTLLKAGNFDPSFQSVSAWSLGLVMALLLFASVLLHELGHSLVARSQGIKVNSITLFIFGGVAAIDRESQTPGDAFQVAIAGPGVSLCLFGLFYGLTQVLPTENLGYLVAADLARINLVLTLFNLIPGLPLDGGQVLKAAIWKLTGNRLQGVRWAAQAGKLIGSLAIAVSLGLALLTGVWTVLWLALIGSFVYRNANAYDRLTILQEALLELQASDTMTRNFRVLDATMSLRSFADEYILADIQTNKPYYAASEGRYRGLVKIQDLQTIERSRWEMESLESLVHPLSDIATVEEKTPLIDVINTLETWQLKHLTVLSPAGAIAGVIDRGDIVRAVAGRLNLPISQEQIQQIKAEGSYPSWLKLSAIAKATTS
ncbi:MAG: site-2 protease family protein [Coleofasciculus sp. D1-CHI-01]|uniref:site-2 protease family protein n=1 Tax=Coleofasciculus sp. D1-CHI-01 TaxID=3068482 RepID=UPI0032F4425D